MLAARWVAAALCVGCGPRIGDPGASGSAGGTTGDSTAQTDTTGSSDDSSSSGPSIEPDFLIALRTENRDPALEERRWLSRMATDGSVATPVAEFEGEIITAQIVGADQDAAYAWINPNGTDPPDHLVRAAEAGVQTTAGNIFPPFWLTTDGLGVWADTIGFGAVPFGGGEPSAVEVDGRVFGMSRSRRFVVADGITDSSLQDLDGQVPSRSLAKVHVPTDDPLCSRSISPAFWPNADATRAVAFPDENLDLLVLDLAPGGGQKTVDAPDDFVPQAWDWCAQRLIGAAGSSLYTVDAEGLTQVVDLGVPVPSFGYGFSLDGRFAIGVDQAVVVIVDLVAGEGVATQLGGRTPGVDYAVGDVSNSFAAIGAVAADDSAFRIDLATRDQRLTPHCGDFPPILVGEDRLVVCRNEPDGERGFGVVDDAGIYDSLGINAQQVMPVRPPTACVTRDTMPLESIGCA